jgi:uncharacterized protein (DUF1697 family)
VAKCVVLLRGVNVGAHNRISMATFREVLEGVGCTDVATYLQSGNAVVTATASGLAGRIEKALAADGGVNVRVLVWAAAALDAVVKNNPFPERAKDPKLLHVAFLDRQPTAAELKAVGLKHGGDEMRAGKKVLYLSYGSGSYASPLNAAVGKLKLVSSARNWRTVLALRDMSNA